jgi:hypothetical protein
MNRYFYVLYPDRSFTNELISLKEDETIAPEYAISVDEFPMPSGLFNPKFDGEKWIGDEPKEAEKIFTNDDLIKALATGDMTKVQKVAQSLIRQSEQFTQQAIAAENDYRKAVGRRKEAIENVRKLAANQAIERTEKKSRRKREPVVEPL